MRALPFGTVATVDTLASSSDTFNLAKPEATKRVTQPNNEIWYTSSDGKVVKPSKEGKGIFGAEIESNTYKNGKGIIKFKGDVTTIEYAAFCSCDCLTSIYCEAIVPPALVGNSVFDYNGSGRKIYVPTESVDAYKSAVHWSEYASDIVGYDF